MPSCARAPVLHVVALTVATAVLTGLMGGSAVSSSSRASTCEGLPATIIGTQGADTIIGTPVADIIVGLGGDDLRGSDGHDRLLGQENGLGQLDCASNSFGQGDKLDGGQGNDWLDGGAGAGLDVVSYRTAANAVTVDLTAGTGIGEGIDTITAGVEKVIGTRFADSLLGSDRRDLLFGGPGPDTVDGGAGDDLLRGDSMERLPKAVGVDTVVGGPGGDRLFGGPRPDIVNAGGGRDHVAPGDGDDQVYAGPSNDSVSNVVHRCGLSMGGGDDTVYGGKGNDFIDYYSSDFLQVSGFHHLLGGPGFDDIRVEEAQGHLNGGGDVDQIIFRSSECGVHYDMATTVMSDCNGTGDAVSFDIVYGSYKGDTILGTDADDAIRSRKGADRIDGRGGDDQLRANLGNDYIDGGDGHDKGRGGHGLDTCIGVETPIGCEQ